MPSSRLQIDFAGLSFKNPFMLSSAPPAMSSRHILRAARLGWGGAVTKTIAEKPTVDPRTRLGALRHDGELVGMNNIELISREELTRWTEDWIPQIKKEAPKEEEKKAEKKFLRLLKILHNMPKIMD